MGIGQLFEQVKAASIRKIQIEQAELRVAGIGNFYEFRWWVSFRDGRYAIMWMILLPSQPVANELSGPSPESLIEVSLEQC